MAESPEHQFLKSEFNRVLNDFSALTLYGFTETERKRFDFSCLIERDWTRPLAGQVLVGNVAGVDKDIRTLLTDEESEIKVYLATDTIGHFQKFEEVVTDYRRSGRYNDLFKLRTVWVPSDFDADKAEQRSSVARRLKSQIVEDILFNVVFGRLTADDIRLFLNTGGTPGLNLAILYDIATRGYRNIPKLTDRLGISSGPVREKLPLIAGAGFISTPIGDLAYEDTAKGRVFLELIARIVSEYRSSTISHELAFILEKLDLRPVSEQEVADDTSVFPDRLFVLLIRTIAHATDTWGIDFGAPDYSDKELLERPPNKLAQQDWMRRQ
ncbi:MAG: hypothetical protein AAF591_20730 [Verrucomicrobiota bacterium]